MSELRKEYQAIVDSINKRVDGNWLRHSEMVEQCALECQCLADSKEPVLLTDAEINDVFNRGAGIRADSPANTTFLGGARAIEAACHAKQKAPVTRDVKVRIYNHKVHGLLVSQVEQLDADDLHSSTNSPARSR